MIFSRGKLRTPHLFYFGEETIGIVNEHNYLCIAFNYNAKCIVAKQNLYQKDKRTMFALLKIINFLYQLR